MPLLDAQLAQHPCFGRCVRGVYGRIHLPVAPKCNIQCGFCDRRYDCANESRPGVTSSVISPEEAVARAKACFAADSRIRVVGIAGPGDPLANPETFETLRLVRETLPQAILCLSTNGVNLEAELDRLLYCQVDTLTMTVNTLCSDTAAKIYSWVTAPEGRLTGKDAANYILKKQRRGLELCKEHGCNVKINTVLIPGINDSEIGNIAEMAADYHCTVMNVMPLIPCGTLRTLPPPTPELLHFSRQTAERYLPVFTHCKQCRADAAGIV